MIKYFFAIFFILGCIPKGYSQKSLSDYSYIIVPNQYEFQNEKDKFQLNSLTKFLFNKFGFNSYFINEVPFNVRRCDGLWADVEGSPGFVFTKTKVIIKDCNGEVVYRSIEGSSKQKDLKKAYYDALRKAFSSIEKMQVKQKEITTYEEESISEKIIVNGKIENTLSKVINDNKTDGYETFSLGNLPKIKFSTYRNNNKEYLLRKTMTGYLFYEAIVNTDLNNGLILKGTLEILKSKIKYINTNGKSNDAYFDASNNLIIKSKKTNIIYNLEH